MVKVVVKHKVGPDHSVPYQNYYQQHLYTVDIHHFVSEGEAKAYILGVKVTEAWYDRGLLHSIKLDGKEV